MATYAVTVRAVVPVDGPRTVPTADLSANRKVRAGSACEAAQLVLADLHLPDGMVGIWAARRRGLLGLGQRRCGEFGAPGGDDGLAGVREPRRPHPPSGAATVALEPPAA